MARWAWPGQWAWLVAFISAAAWRGAPVFAMPEADLQSSVDAEVQKLQELVRSLEQQNQQLRSRAAGPESPRYRLSEDEAQPSFLDQLELLDLSSPSCWDDDETWLYRPPRTQPPPLDALTPLQWCRRVLDGLRSDQDAGPHTVPWGRVSLFCPSPLSLSPAPLRESPVRTSCSTPQSSDKLHAPPLLLLSPRHPTLSPVRRELLPSLARRSPTLIRSGAGGPQGSVDGGLGSDLDDSAVQSFKLQDLLDVQVVARLQEESLRRDLVRASSAGHSRSFGFLSGGSGLDEEEEDQDQDCSFLPRRPRLLAAPLPHSRTLGSIRDLRAGPPARPRSASPTQLLGGRACWDPARPELRSGPGRATAGLQDLSPALDVLRRSMPNLARGPGAASVPVLACPSSAPRCLRSSWSFDWPAALTPRRPAVLLQNRVHGADAASPSGQPSKATAYVSPTVKASWSSAPSTPRSSLPRPAASAGTSSTPRSRVNQSARRTPLGPPRDLSWRE